MELTFTQKKELYTNGIVKVPGVVPQIMVDAALRAINHSLGEGMPPEKLNIFRSQSYCPEVQSTPAISDLFHKTPAKDLLGSVIDIDQIHQFGGGQIALRFPGADTKPRPAQPHIDGMYSPHNGVKQGTISNFTALLGVFLSDLPSENAGNFTVWPTSHHRFEKYFQEHGAASLLNGLPPVEMPEPLQITGKAGDVAIVHYLLGHGVTPNVSPHTRYAIFFRIKHVDIDTTNWQQSMENIWMHWAGMREVI